MAEATAELDFIPRPRPRPRRASGPAAPASSGAPRNVAPVAAPTPRSLGRPARPFDSEQASQTAEPPALVPGAGVSGRRTVAIQGRPADRYSSTAQRRRPTRRPHEREGFRPDRAAMWAVFLGFVLVLVAATSSHAATRTHRASRANHHAATLTHRASRANPRVVVHHAASRQLAAGTVHLRVR